MSAFLFSRVSFVIVLACAAVVSFIISSHAAKAYATVAPFDSGVDPSLRSYKRFSLLSSEPGILPGTVPETAQNWKAPNRDAQSMSFSRQVYLQSNSPRKGHSNYGPNSQHNQPNLEGMTQLQGGRHLGGVKPARSTSTLLDLPRINHNTFFQSQNGGVSGFVAPNNGNSQSWLSPIFRKSLQQERPLPPRDSQVQKVYDYDQIPRSGPSALPESRTEKNIDGQSPYSSPMSFRRSGYWSSQSNTNRDGKEGHAGTSGILLNKPPSFLNQMSSLLPSGSISLESNEFKPEKMTSPITLHTSQDKFPANSNVKTSYKRVQSYLLRNIPHTTHAPKGVNTQISQHSVYNGQDFSQQTRTNSMLLRNENKFSGHIGDAVKYDPVSVIYRVPKTDISTSHEDPNSARRNSKDAISGLGDTGSPKNPFENIQPKERLNPTSGLASWPVLKKSSPPSIDSKEANSEARSYVFMRPSTLQKYSFGQRLRGPEKTSTTPKSLSWQDYGSALDFTLDRYRSKAENHFKSGAVSTTDEQKIDSKPHAKSADILKLVTRTRIKPQSKLLAHGTALEPFNRRYKQGKVKDKEFKAVTYDDIIGSASFSSVTPAKRVTSNGNFEKEKKNTQSKTLDYFADVMYVNGKANTSNINATEEGSVSGEEFYFKEEAETESGESDLSVSEKESEAKKVPDGLSSDPEENIESDSLLEMHYLRTSTGNVSFQSLNLNLSSI